MFEGGQISEGGGTNFLGNLARGGQISQEILPGGDKFLGGTYFL